MFKALKLPDISFIPQSDHSEDVILRAQQKSRFYGRADLLVEKNHLITG